MAPFPLCAPHDQNAHKQYSTLLKKKKKTEIQCSASCWHMLASPFIYKWELPFSPTPRSCMLLFTFFIRFSPRIKTHIWTYFSDKICTPPARLFWMCAELSVNLTLCRVRKQVKRGEGVLLNHSQRSRTSVKLIEKAFRNRVPVWYAGSLPPITSVLITSDILDEMCSVALVIN